MSSNGRKYLGPIEDGLDIVNVDYLEQYISKVVYKDVTDLETSGTVKISPYTTVVANDKLSKCYAELTVPTNFETENLYGLRFQASDSWDSTTGLNITCSDSNVQILYDACFPTIESGKTYDVNAIFFNKTTALIYGHCIEDKVKAGSYATLHKSATDVATKDNLKLNSEVALIIDDACDKCYVTLTAPSSFTDEHSHRIRFTASSSWSGPLSLTSSDSGITITYDPEFPTIQAGYTYDIVASYYNSTNIVVYGKELSIGSKIVVLNEN